jgi:hypothetical protein
LQRVAAASCTGWEEGRTAEEEVAAAAAGDEVGAVHTGEAPASVHTHSAEAGSSTAEDSLSLPLPLPQTASATLFWEVQQPRGTEESDHSSMSPA